MVGDNETKVEVVTISMVERECNHRLFTNFEGIFKGEKFERGIATKANEKPIEIEEVANEDNGIKRKIALSMNKLLPNFHSL